ncbi:MAG: hypothetical protein GC179_18685 [Anaerolineaceae bacterium]|nr:hypothetical protein [Anaerolineaceae bacterium]
MKYSRPTIWMVLAFLFVTPFAAYLQDGECTTFVKQALAATDKACINTGRNEACYGHISLDAQPQSQDPAFKFNEVGDRVDVARVSRLRLSPMDVKSDVWGVALLKVQADIPNDMPNANVSVLVFGDVELENAIPDPVFVDVVVAGPSNANIRRQPSNRGFVLSSLAPTTKVQAKGRSKDGAWLYIGLPGGKGNGWVRRSLMKSTDDLTKLKELDPSLTSYGPMQAFYLQNGKKQTSCQSVPNDGILIQTPEGVAQVQLWINEVKIKLGSTAFIQAQPENKVMTVTTLEGAAHVEALGVEQVAVAGTTVTVRVDENQKPIAPPSLPQAYNINEAQNLTAQSLDRPVTAAPPVNVTPTFTPTMTFTPVVSSPTVTASPSLQPSKTLTFTPVAPTNTLIPTSTSIVLTNTNIPTITFIPSNTNAPVPTNSPTSPTAVPPTVVSSSTNTPVPPTAAPALTNTSVPPTAAPAVTNTPVLPTAIPPTDVPPSTNTPIPPTAAPAVTNTAVPPTAAPAASATGVSAPANAPVATQVPPTNPPAPTDIPVSTATSVS